MNAAESSIALEQPIRSGRFCPPTPNKWSRRTIVSILGSLTFLAFFIWSLSTLRWGPPTTSEPATQVGPPTAGATVPDWVVGPRVVGGEEAKPNDWPWQISLQELRRGSFHHFCGATLINKRWAMTAAHCVEEPESDSELRAVVGEHDLSSVSGREQVVTVAEVHIHPKWNGYVGEGNDIALLRFDSDVILNQWVQPASLPPAGQILPHNTTCYVTGWGLTDSGRTVRLMQAYLPLVDHQTCSRADWWGQSVKTIMVCAGGNGIQGGCQGDSGGPLNCEVNSTHVVHGVTSFGIRGCKQSKKPTVFTRVSAYIDWIDQIIN